MSKELTQYQFQEQLMDVHLGSVEVRVKSMACLRNHDAAQRATIQQLDEKVKELTVVASRVLKLEEHIREVCGIELNVLSNMGISFVEKAVRWYQQRVKELESIAPPCRWRQNEAGSYAWMTACGESLLIEDGTPEDNKMKWCCYCGGKVEREQP